MNSNKLTVTFTGDDDSEYVTFRYSPDEISCNSISFQYKPSLLALYEVFVNAVKKNINYIFHTEGIQLEVNDGHVLFNITCDNDNDPYSQTEFKLKTEQCIDAFDKWIDKLKRSTN